MLTRMLALSQRVHVASRAPGAQVLWAWLLDFRFTSQLIIDGKHLFVFNSAQDRPCAFCGAHGLFFFGCGKRRSFVIG